MGRSIVRQPKAFLFDEPLSNLDALLRAEMRVEIKKLHQRLGNTIIYVTHDQVEAMTLADRIVVLQAGNLIQYDTPDGIYNRPAAKFVAGFTGSPPMNFLPCRVGEAGRTLHLPGGVDLPVPAARVAGCARHAGRNLTFGLRPEHISAGASTEPASVPVRSEVMLVEPLGSDTLGLIKLGTGGDAGEMTGRFPPESGLVAGTPLTVSLAMHRFHLFDPDTGAAMSGTDR
jgi:ABC-type sugar transport system ATPase subunit